MPDTGTPPPVPPEFQIYNSYLEDPKWQRRFSVTWVSLVGLVVLFSLPHLVRSIKCRRAFPGFFGIWENISGRNYVVVSSEPKVEEVEVEVEVERVDEKPPARKPSSPESEEGEVVEVAEVEAPEEKTSGRCANRPAAWFRNAGSVRLWCLPGISLNTGQVVVILAYAVLVLLFIVLNAPLSSNANRPGFIALAQLPVVFLFATKNSVLSLLLGPGNGYEKLNYIHRWSGRCMFLGAVLHGTLWIQNHLTWNIPILGKQKETSGVAALGLLCIIVLSSLYPVRKYCYQGFFVIHVLTFVAFFVTICYHTIYASPWIFPPLALYGLDMFMRMLRYRIKDATLTFIDRQMTIIRVADCDGGWQAGQHVRLRVFFSGRVFESHPLTILKAPSSSSCISSADSALLILGARVSGDWTRALNEYAQSEGTSNSNSVQNVDNDDSAEGSLAQVQVSVPVPVPVQVMLDGPYGGCGIDLGRYEKVLLVAGGSGTTFTIGLLDDIVARCVKLGRRGGEVTRKIEFVWCTRSFGWINWFAPFLTDIANAAATATSGTSLDLHISIFVTCICDPEAVPHIPNCDVLEVTRPSVHALLLDLVSPPLTRSSPVDVEKGSSDSNTNAEGGGSQSGSVPVVDSPPLRRVGGGGGGVGVCASGPESMTREAQNAVARLGMSRRVLELGGIAIHVEPFAL